MYSTAQYYCVFGVIFFCCSWFVLNRLLHTQWRPFSKAVPDCLPHTHTTHMSHTNTRTAHHLMLRIADLCLCIYWMAVHHVHRAITVVTSRASLRHHCVALPDRDGNIGIKYIQKPVWPPRFEREFMHLFIYFFFVLHIRSCCVFCVCMHWRAFYSQYSNSLFKCSNVRSHVSYWRWFQKQLRNSCTNRNATTDREPNSFRIINGQPQIKW